MNVVSVQPQNSSAALLVPHTDDEAVTLLARIAEGDPRALERFYKLTVGRVFGVALRITRRREVAEEVAEEVFVQVWLHASRFDPMRGAPMAWLMTICRSRAIDSLRQRDAAISDPDPQERPDSIVPPVPDLQDLLQATQRHRALHAALERLRPAQLQLLTLAYFRDMTHTELAAHTGMPMGTVKSQLRRTLAELRQMLDTD